MYCLTLQQMNNVYGGSDVNADAQNEPQRNIPLWAASGLFALGAGIALGGIGIGFTTFLSGCPALGGDMGSLVGALQGTYCSCSDGCFIAPFIARIMLGGMPCYFGCCLPVPLVTILGGGFLLGFMAMELWP